MILLWPCSGERHRSAANAACVIVFALLCDAAAAGSAALSEPAALGRDLYFGVRAFGEAANVGGAPLPAGIAACVACHGPLGEGSREGAQFAPSLRGANIAGAPDWVQAATLGLRHDGGVLAQAMPRYRLSAQEVDALRAYAAVLGTPGDVVRGVDDHELRLGVVQREAGGAGGPAVDADALVLRGVERVFNEVNAHGGVNGRILRAVPLRSMQDAGHVFAIVASVAPDTIWSLTLAALRLPDLASLTLTRETASVRSWSLPLLPSLRQQAALLASTLASTSRQYDCTPWLVDTMQLTAQSNAPKLSNASTGSTPAPDVLLRHAGIDAAVSARRPARLCLGVIAEPASLTPLFEALRRDGTPVPLLLSLAALGTMPSDVLNSGPGRHQQQILPAPAALAAHADRAGQALWVSLGEASARAAVEALARSGRLLQPERVLAKMRELGGFSPLPDTSLAWNRTQAHGWAPTLWPPGEAESVVASGRGRTLQTSGEAP